MSEYGRVGPFNLSGIFILWQQGWGMDACLKYTRTYVAHWPSPCCLTGWCHTCLSLATPPPPPLCPIGRPFLINSTREHCSYVIRLLCPLLSWKTCPIPRASRLLLYSIGNRPPSRRYSSSAIWKILDSRRRHSSAQYSANLGQTGTHQTNTADYLSAGVTADFPSTPSDMVRPDHIR